MRKFQLVALKFNSAKLGKHYKRLTRSVHAKLRSIRTL